MARVLMATQPWGVIQRRDVNNVVSILATKTVHMANTDGSAATTWTAQTGGSSTTADTITDSNGAMPNWIEEGEYDQTIDGVTKRVEASGTGPGIRIIATATSATAVQAAITSLGVAGGEIVLLPGTHTWDIIPTIPPAITGRLRIRGQPGAKIVHTTGARRCFDWGKVADYDTFQNVDIGYLLVDCGSFGGRHHVVIGPWQNGSWQRKINLLNVHVHDIEILNAPVGTDPNTDFRIGASLSMSASPATDSQCTAKRCSVKRIWSDGCLQLVNVQGAPVGTEATANTFHDDITVEDVQHYLPTTPTPSTPAPTSCAGPRARAAR
jgi:hypothetical protein